MQTKAIRVDEVGGPERLVLADVDVPDPGPGFARIRLERIGVNFIDTYHRTGLYPLPLPFVPGVEAAGVRVMGTCSTEEKAAIAHAAGADEIVRYDREDFRERARAFTDGRGVDVVYDSVGRSTFEGSLGSLRPRGLLCLFGQASGPVPPFDLGRLNGAGSLFVTRPSLGHYVATRAELELRAGWVFASLVEGRLRQTIGGHYALADATAAHRDLESRRTTGKLLLDTV